MFYFFLSITTDFNISSSLRWAIQDQWSSGFTSITQKLKEHIELDVFSKASVLVLCGGRKQNTQGEPPTLNAYLIMIISSPEPKAHKVSL